LATSPVINLSFPCFVVSVRISYKSKDNMLNMSKKAKLLF
jgi:hypothetical protein